MVIAHGTDSPAPRARPSRLSGLITGEGDDSAADAICESKERQMEKRQTPIKIEEERFNQDYWEKRESEDSYVEIKDTFIELVDHLAFMQEGKRRRINISKYCIE